ncbi:MAG: MoxR family ATPase [Phycisphaerae bacterium]
MAVDFDPKLVEQLACLKRNVAKVFFGRPEVVDQLIVGLLAGGHVLVEDVPGVGKTILARTLAKSIHCTFARIQLTPDLLPSDILGVSIYNEQTRNFEFKKGPIFANIVLADEVNRTTPRTQSAMLEAMNEGQISIDGHTFTLEKPFMVIATQNPFEFEGTYILPENQLDRFILRITIGYPSPEQEARIILERPARAAMTDLQPVLNSDEVIALQKIVDQVHISKEVMDYTLHFIHATRNHKHLDLGLSPRGGQALIRAAQARSLIEKRDFVIPEDIKYLAVPVCAHRVLSKSYIDESHSSSTSSIITQIINDISVPV